jgi:hypothetical protein
MAVKRKLENDKQMGERNLVGFTLLDAGTERQMRRYNKTQSVTNVNTGANATLVLALTRDCTGLHATHISCQHT